MNRSDVVKLHERERERRSSVEMPNDYSIDYYGGVDAELAPKMLESLVPWDVSARARREQVRLSSAAYRIPRGIHGGY